MSSLLVKFPECWHGWDIKELPMSSAVVDAESHCAADADGLTIRVVSNSCADIYSDAPVFFGIMTNTRRPTQRSTVALKFAMRDDVVAELAHETEMYLGPLEALQGSVVPTCHGLYSATKDGSQTIACLVLEHCGEVITRPFVQLPLASRLRILEAIVSIHQQGVLHGDIAERNILQRQASGDMRIIDFGQARWHQCHCNTTFRPGPAPDRESFGCDYLWDVCRFMNIWSS